MIGTDDKVDEEDVIKGLEQIKSVEPDLGQVCLLLAVSNLATPVQTNCQLQLNFFFQARKFLTTQFNLKEISHVLCYNFYVPPSAYQQIRAKVDEIVLPPSFSIGSTRMSDAEIVNSTWKFATPEDILQQKWERKWVMRHCLFSGRRSHVFRLLASFTRIVPWRLKWSAYMGNCPISTRSQNTEKEDLGLSLRTQLLGSA